MIRIAICDDNEIICEELAGLTEAFMKKQNREYRIDKFKSGEEVCSSFLRNPFYFTLYQGFYQSYSKFYKRLSEKHAVIYAFFTYFLIEFL